MRRRALRAERLLEAPRRVLGDVLVEGPGRRARLEDALDGAMLEGAEPRGVGERSVEVTGDVAGAQHQDAARLVAPHPRWTGTEQPEERDATRPQAVERHGELAEVHRAPAARWRMETLGVELVPGAARRELVARDARQVGGVHEQLALGDAHRQDVGHVVVGHGVAIALPVDEAVDAAHADRSRARCRTGGAAAGRGGAFPRRTARGRSGRGGAAGRRPDRASRRAGRVYPRGRETSGH